MGDMDLYTYAHYVYKHGATLEELENAESIERVFYTASMLFCRKEETDNRIALAKVSNPFLKTK